MKTTRTRRLSSAQLLVVLMLLTLPATAFAIPLVWNKTFSPDEIAVTGTTTLTFQITNPNPSPAAGVVFTDPLPAGLEVAPVPNVMTTGSCAGVFIPMAGDTVIGLAAGAFPPGAVCTYSVDILATTTGTKNNVTGPLGSSQGPSPGVMDTLEVSPPPEFSKAFDDSQIQIGTTTTLRFDISNSGGLTASNLSFTDNFPAGLVVGTPPNVNTGACGGTLIAVAGAGSISYSGGSLTGGQACEISLSIEATTLGNKDNVSGDLTSDLGNSGNATDSVIVFEPPGFAKNFRDSSLGVGQPSALKFKIDNTSNVVPATNLSFTDTLPAGLEFTICLAGSDTCDGERDLSGPDETLIYSSGEVSAGSQCEVECLIRAISVGTQDNVSGNLTSSLGDSGTASDSVVVLSDLGFSKVFTDDSISIGGTTTLTFNIDNTPNAESVGGIQFTDDLPAGLVVATPSNAGTSCSGGTLTAMAGSGTISYSEGSVSSSSSCTVTVDIEGVTEGQKDNVSGFLLSDIGLFSQATDTITVTSPPLFSKVFGDEIIAPGEVTTLTFTIDNTANVVSADDLDFNDSLPAGLFVADQSSLITTCLGGTLSSGFLENVSYTGGSVPDSATCTISVDIIADSYGQKDNLSEDLTSSLGNSGMAADSILVAEPPLFSKAFNTDSMPVGDRTRLQFHIDNTANTVSANQLQLIDSLPSGLRVAVPANFSTTCVGGSMTTNPPRTSIQYTGGLVPGDSSCTMVVDVQGFSVGQQNNISHELTSSLGNSGRATDDIVVYEPPLFSKEFADATMRPFSGTTLTFTIDNTANAISADDLDFRDPLPDGLRVGSPSSLLTTCIGGTLSSTDMGTVIRYTGGMVAGGSSCTIEVEVLATLTGQKDNVTEDLTSTLGNSGTATDSIFVTSSPLFSKQFADETINLDEVTTLTFTIDNTVNPVEATDLDFTDDLPGGLVVASPSNLSTTCTGGTLTGAEGTGTVSYTGGTVAASSSCTIDVDLLGIAGGQQNNQTGFLTSSLGSSFFATDSIFVTTPPLFSKQFADTTIILDDVTTLTFTIDNTSNIVGANGLDFTDIVPIGLVVASPSNLSTTCTGGTLTGAVGTGTVSYTGGSVTDSSSCTIDVDLQGISEGQQDNLTGDLTSTLGNSGTAADSINVIIPNDIGVTKGNGANFVSEGETFDYTITVRNLGPEDVTGIEVEDLLPPTLDMGTATWVCSPGPGATCTANGVGDIVDTVDIPSGEEVVYTLTVTVTGSESESVSNTVTVTTPPGITDVVPGNNSASDDDPIGVFADGLETLTDES